MKLYQDLNDEQYKAVTHGDGPLLILAGAGSGKTRVLTCRIAYLVENKGVNPDDILAITFTNKAAREMKERVEQMLGGCVKGMWICTFHSACVRILRRHIDKIGYNNSFVIYDENDQLSIIKDIIKELNISDKYYPPKSVKAEIGHAKDDIITPSEYAKMYGEDFYKSKIAEVYTLYQRRLQRNNALDFDDIINKTIELFTLNPHILKHYQDKFRYLLVDEYQDTNKAQYLVVKMLSESHRNLCVVGDDDQCIYQWRGADIRNIKDFQKDFKDATVIKLEQNYRSTGNILDCANSIIRHIADRSEKKLWTQQASGSKLKYYGADSDWDEARFIVSRIKELVQEGKKYGDFAILYRTNAQSRVIEDALVEMGVPYRIVGGLKFYDRKEIKDIIAYLRLLVNPQDDVSLKRIINVPKRGIGKATVEVLEGAARDMSTSMLNVLLKEECQDVLGARAAAKVREFTQVMLNLMDYKVSAGLVELVEEVLDKTGYIQMLEAEKDKEGLDRMANVEELISAVKGYEEMNEGESPTMEGFLENVSLVSDIDTLEEDCGSVVLMTAHSAKGLEFPVVFVSGMEEGLFPHLRSSEDSGRLEEERRLCYVAFTRAQQQLYITSARKRMVYGNTIYTTPSRFVDEIPHNLVEEVGDTVKKRNNTITLGKVAQKDIPRGKAEFNPGSKVKHTRFGVGTIVSVKGSGEDVELKIAFPDLGIKQFIAKYAPIKVMD
ncbi:MAG: DNA helicase PcrA [Mahellales bacterium]|jgi:DNA helicase-2/ATP-dependent DNA helicase PcrA